MARYSKIFLIPILILWFFAGCYRGKPSEQPPIHLNPDMDNQPRYDPQSESPFFSDDASMRTPVSGTVARGALEDEIFHRGKESNGDFVIESPVAITVQNLKRGQERFNIYCSVCHGRAGDGQGIMLSRGYVPPPSFHNDRIKNMRDGEIFNVITNGIRNMPAYRFQVSAKDRWAIVQYIRALQRSQNATINDIPVELKDKIK